MGKKKAQHALIGAHMSISGGVEQAPLRGRDIGCACVQIFTKSNRQWAARPLSEKEIGDFKKNCEDTGIAPVLGHNCYLINLGAPDRALWRKSFDCFLIEVQRSDQLGLLGIVFHPGSHVGAGEKPGLRRIIRAVNDLIEKTKCSKVRLLVETTAGQGTNLGCRFEHLAEIITSVKQKGRVGVCYDTCHTFAAGYDIRTEDAYHRTLEEFDKVVGLDELCAFHFNDSKGELGSRLDRHEHIGRGELGKEPFRLILQDARFRSVPKLLETPKGKRGKTEWDVVNLNLLRRLATAK